MINIDYPSEVITSSGNSTIKYIKSLRQRKNRDISHQYLVEGPKMVKEAFKAKVPIELIVFSEDSIDLLEELKTRVLDKGTPHIIVTKVLFEQISDTKTPQGVLAVVAKQKGDFVLLLSKSPCFLVVLDGIKDPGNLGTIIRTQDAVGGDGIILINSCVDTYNPKVVRSTMGSIFRVPLFSIETLDVLKTLSSNGFHIVTSHLRGENIFKWSGGYDKTALVIGSESHGASEDTVNISDSLVKIPMPGGAESLNASVAAGVLIYEILKKAVKMDE